VLKVGHHGSSTSTSDAFLAAVELAADQQTIGAEYVRALAAPPLAVTFGDGHQTAEVGRGGVSGMDTLPSGVAHDRPAR